MIKLKDLKERFTILKTINVDGAYHLYSNDLPGKRINKEYLGYVIVKNGKATHFPSNSVATDIDIFVNDVMNWYNNRKYEASTYNPDMRKSYVAEIRIHDHLIDLGFEFNNKSSYCLYSTMATGEKNILIRFKFEVNDRFDNDSNITAAIITGMDSWIDLSADSYTKVIDNINAMVKVIILDSIANNINKFEKIENIDLSILDTVMMKKLSGLNVNSSSFKDYIIETLENTLNKIKK